MTIESIQNGLAEYGARLDEQGFICYEINGVDKTLGIRVVLKRGRMRCERADGSLVFSGGQNAEAISHFVERFWFWKKVECAA